MAGLSRGKNGKFTRSLDTAEKDAEAARLRARGQSYREIAAALGYQDDSGSYRAVQRALVATVAEPADELRALQVAQLDMLAQQALGVLEREHISISQGRVMCIDDVPVPDDGPVLAAIDRLLKIQERRAKLLGLDAPSRHEVVSLDALDAEINRLSAELGRTPAVEAAGTEGTSG
jgi:hypothetical protein